MSLGYVGEFKDEHDEAPIEIGYLLTKEKAKLFETAIENTFERADKITWKTNVTSDANILYFFDIDTYNIVEPILAEVMEIELD